jgi:sugar transferase (PEP-CTERM/EpsH1 system associated)
MTLIKVQSDRNIKIVHLVYSFEVGGLEQIILNSIAKMPAHYQHTVIALTHYSESFVSTISSPFEIIKLNKAAGQDWRIFVKLFNLFRSLKPDVLHSYNLATIEYQPLAWLAGVPLRLHAEHGRDSADPQGKNKKHQYLRRLSGVFIHKVIAVSEDLFQWLIEEVKLPTSKCQLIENGVDTDKYHPPIAAALSQQSLVFGHVARLQSIKNQHNLIQAFKQARGHNALFRDNARLVIVGEGPLAADLQHLAQKDGVQPIEFLGKKHNMPQIYQQFDAFVMSSDAEGIPMTMLEAMATGLPVLSTRVGGIPQITTKQQAVLVEAQSIDALCAGFLALFAQQGQFLSMGQCSRQLVVDNFSEKKMLNHYQHLYSRGADNVRD